MPAQVPQFMDELVFCLVFIFHPTSPQIEQRFYTEESADTITQTLGSWLESNFPNLIHHQGIICHSTGSPFDFTHGPEPVEGWP
jgi:hypothetical protein